MARDDELAVPPALRGVSVAGRHERLRELLTGPGTFVVPGVVDALSAKLVERAGFDAAFITGAGIANAQLALPDVGLLTLTEMVDQTQRIAGATAIPLIADGDTGHGGPLSVMRCVHLMEAAGVSGITLEDQAMPKRCGHLDGQRLVTVEEMVARLEAAQRARRDPNFVIIARTDARGTEGFEPAMERSRHYIDAGADAVFVEAPRSIEELEEIPRRLSDVPLVVNVVEGGKTPQLPAAELAKLGYRVVLHANFLMRVSVEAGRRALEHLQSTGSTDDLIDRVLSWSDRQDLVDLPLLDALDDDFRRGEQAMRNAPE